MMAPHPHAPPFPHWHSHALPRLPVHQTHSEEMQGISTRHQVCAVWCSMLLYMTCRCGEYYLYRCAVLCTPQLLTDGLLLRI